jgi:hypothetical protein
VQAPGASLDLHVLSAPPAFVLSQDQTLREELVVSPRAHSLRFELVLDCLLKDRREIYASRFGATASCDPSARGLDVFHAVEFSKTVPLRRP